VQQLTFKNVNNTNETKENNRISICWHFWEYCYDFNADFWHQNYGLNAIHNKQYLIIHGATEIAPMIGRTSSHWIVWCFSGFGKKNSFSVFLSLKFLCLCKLQFFKRSLVAKLFHHFLLFIDNRSYSEIAI